MQLKRFHNVQDFWLEAKAFLLQHESEHSWLIGNIQTLLHHRDRYPERLHLVTVQDNASILAAAVQIPPHKLLLSKAQNLDALTVIAQDLSLKLLPGVAGLAAEVATFVQRWRTFTDQIGQQTEVMQIYDLTSVLPVPPVDGILRLATEADRPLLMKWIPAFFSEVVEMVHDPVEQILESGLKHQDFYLWEDGTTVALAAGKRFDQIARIGLVYTPPEHRQKGYATACVASLSQSFLAQGYRRCFLFADLAHPTSNSIYQKIGYRPVSHWQEYCFK